MTLRGIWQWIENFSVSFFNEFIDRSMSALEMMAERNFLDWDIGVILYAAFRWWLDFSLMAFAVMFLLYIVFAILALLFTLLGLEKVHNKIDSRYGYGLGSAIICLFWSIPFIIFFILYLILT